VAFHGEGGELVAVTLADGMDMDDRTLVEKARATLLQVSRFGDVRDDPPDALYNGPTAPWQ